MKRTKLDDLMAKMADPSRMGPRAVLPTSSPSATATAAAASASTAAGSTHVESSSQVPSAPTAFETHRTKKQSSKRDRAKVVKLEGEEGLQEDPAADLQQKRQKKKAKVDDAFEKALGNDSAWEHDVNPLKVAFPKSFNYRKALNASLTSAPVGVETSLGAKVKAEKELSVALDQIEVLKGEKDSALLYLPLKEKVDDLDDQLSERSAEYRSALDRIALLEEDNRVFKTQFESSQLSLEEENKRSEAAEKQLGSEVTVMCQETLDICLDQVSHICLGVDFSAITLKSRWDPKGRRIFVPQESEVEEERPQVEEVVPGQHPGVTTQGSQPAVGDVAGVSGECPTENL
ncbi:hypothetical protein PIB30_030982 [Stylosanthes scabra]|uniref:Uncharacterized protein n=1 Tax=Stylosanthes scabra TaxID=79078 RepID=A0ABU6UAI1_9FABA|nr:hypothetical protein [Stylosanthes scabra]